MKISRKSWHYKLNNFFTSPPSYYFKDLCTYFWRTVFNVLLAIILTGLVCWFIGALIWKIITDPYMMLLVFTIVAMVFVPMIAIMISREYYRTDKMTIERTAPNIVVERYKAFKGRYCPKVEYID